MRLAVEVSLILFLSPPLTQIPLISGQCSHRSHSHGIARLTLNLTEASRQLHSKGSHRSHRSHGIARLVLNLTDDSVSGGLIWGCCGGGKHLFHPFKSNLHLFKINYKNRVNGLKLDEIGVSFQEQSRYLREI